MHHAWTIYLAYIDSRLYNTGNANVLRIKCIIIIIIRGRVWSQGVVGGAVVYLGVGGGVDEEGRLSVVGDGAPPP